VGMNILRRISIIPFAQIFEGGHTTEL